MNCRANRKQRLRRNRKFLDRLAAKRLTRAILRANNGPNMAYYTLQVWAPKTTVRNGVRLFVGKVHYSLKPNQKYRDLLGELLRMSEGITVRLPAELFGQQADCQQS
jgi:hypothetical protein